MAILLATALGGLRLALEKRANEVHGAAVCRYALILSDASETEVMRFVLPESFVDEFRVESADLDLAMSPDGTISTAQSNILDTSENTPIGLDELVARNITPDMLMDEPHAREMLAKLRERLTTALSSVDTAFATLQE